MKRKWLALVVCLVLFAPILTSMNACSCIGPGLQNFSLIVEGGYVFENREQKINWDVENGTPNNFLLARAGTTVYIASFKNGDQQNASIRWILNDEIISNETSFAFVIPMHNTIIRAEWTNGTSNYPYPPDYPIVPDEFGMKRAIINHPYTPRHDGVGSHNTLYELPVLRVGQIDSMPQFVYGDTRNWANALPIIDCYDRLNSLRLGYSRSSFPIVHGYTREFFEYYALWFYTARWVSDSASRIEFEALVTCSRFMTPIIRFIQSANNWRYPSPDGGISGTGLFLLEIPRVLLEYYEVRWFSTRYYYINRLEDVQKIYCDAPFGLYRGECDAVVIELEINCEDDIFIFHMYDDTIFFEGRGIAGVHSRSYDIYNLNHSKRQPVTWVWRGSSGILHEHRSLLSLNLVAGINTIRVSKGHTSINWYGVHHRYVGFFEIYVAYEVYQRQLDFSIEGERGDYLLYWGVNGRRYFKQAGANDFYRIRYVAINIFIDRLDLERGVNTIKVLGYAYNDGVVTRWEARHEIVRGEDESIEYDFWIEGASDDYLGNIIVWGDGWGLYFVHVLRGAGGEFVWHNVIWGEWLFGLEFEEGFNAIKIRQLVYRGGMFVIKEAIFEFYYVFEDVTDSVNFAFDYEQRLLTWDSFGGRLRVELETKRVGSDFFSFLSFALPSLWAAQNIEAIRINFGWRLEGGVLTRYVAYWWF